MGGPVDAAAEAHREAVAGLAQAKELARARVAEARERVAQTREGLAAAIVEEAEDGVPQVDLIRRSGYSRERVRLILRAGGIEPD